MNIKKLNTIEIKNSIENREIKAQEIAEYYLKRAISLQEKTNAFITLDEENILKQAKDIDNQVEKGFKGKLTGVPIAIKDNICTKGLRTTCASKILSNFVPPYDATVIENLKKEGAIIFGKTNMDEFAMGSSNETSYFGPVKNPWDMERIPGGSSGGSAVAVSAILAPASLGSDTGGSIRQPASLCGVVGMKPTYGRISRYGLIAFGSSLDQIGPFARSIEDCALILEVISKYDPRDSTSINLKTPEYLKNLNEDIRGLKIGVPKEYFIDGVEEDIIKGINDAVEILKKLGAEIREISLPHTKYGIAVYYLIATAEASSNLARYDGVKYGFRAENVKDLKEMYIKTKKEGFGEEVKRRIMLGTFSLASGYYDAYYKKASKVRTLIKNDFVNAFEKVDVILCPTSPTTAFKIGEKTNDPIQMYLSDIFTINVNLAGIPAISVPCGFDKKGLPIGMQIIGNYFEEQVILNASYAYEKAVGGFKFSPFQEE